MTKSGNTMHHRHTEKISSLTCIALCSIGELFGGVERHILGLLNGLRAHEIETLLFLFYDGELADQVRAQGFEPIILPNRNCSLVATSRYMARILEQRQVQVVHVHGYKATVYSALARCWYPFAIVKTEHGLPEPMAGRPIQALRDRFYRILDIFATRITGATVCYVTAELQAHYHYAHSGLQVITIPNGIARIDRSLSVRPPELSENVFNLAIVGRLDTIKGHHLAIEAISAAEDMLPDLHLQIIGTGPCEALLRALAETRGIAHKIHFLGFRRNVYDYIAHCHILLIPSLHEGLPYTLLEAMALGTPIIASQVGGLAEVLSNEETALLVPPGDIFFLTQSIIRLHNDPALRCRLGSNAQRLQKTHFSIEKMAAYYLDIYRNLLKTI